jgi:hypothetical protein
VKSSTSLAFSNEESKGEIATSSLEPQSEGRSANVTSSPVLSLRAVKVQANLTMVGTRSLSFQHADPNINTDTDEPLISRSEQIIRKMVRPARRPIHYNLGTVIQDWEGCVTSIRDTSFTARLLDRTRRMKIDTEVAEIPFDQVDAADRDLIKEGSIFYLTIRREILNSGRHIITNGIVFRRLPAWHESSLKRIRSEAEELASFFKSDVDR